MTPVGYELVPVSHSGAGSQRASLSLRGAPGPPPGASHHAVPGEGCGHRASLSDPRGQGLCSAHPGHAGPSPVLGSRQACEDTAEAEVGQASLGSASLGSVLPPPATSSRQVTSEHI